MHRLLIHLSCVLFFGFVFSLPHLAADNGPAEAPLLSSRSAVLMDVQTGIVLYEKNADLLIPPASLTKLMTMHIVFEAMDAGKVSLDDVVALPRESWAINQSPGSSLMFLAPGQTVTLRELLLGLSVSSGNDAAIATALHIAPSIEEFASLMNKEASKLGLIHTHFVEPSGISSRNISSAREFSIFAREYIYNHPESLRDFHSVREFAYPKPHNLPEIFRDKPGTIKQNNRNLLLDSIEGVDGLKTGFIYESGFNIALTALRDNTRLLAVLLGGPGSTSRQGGRIRAEDGAELLEWGFENYKTIELPFQTPEPVRVWKGQQKYVELVIDGSRYHTAPKNRAQNLYSRIDVAEPLIAPIQKGSFLGELIYSDDYGELKRIALLADQDIPQGNWLKRMGDSIVLFFKNLSRKLSGMFN